MVPPEGPADWAHHLWVYQDISDRGKEQSRREIEEIEETEETAMTRRPQ